MEIVTLRVGVRAKEGERGGGGEKNVFSSFSPPSREFHHGAFPIKTIRPPDENACTAGYRLC